MNSFNEGTLPKRNGFYRTLFSLVLPIALQNLIVAAQGTANVIMLGYVSQTALSAVALANQILFILNLFYAGLSIGMTMLIAQYWGKGDITSVETIYGIVLKISVGISAVFCAAAFFVPDILMLIFTSDHALIGTGAEYLRIVSVSYLMMGISQMYLNAVRSIERVRISTVINSSALILGIFLNAVFIFGLFGIHKMGVPGVAVATVIANAAELIWCVVDLVCQKKVHFRLASVFRKNALLFKDFWHYTLPALGNECVWGCALSMYSVIMGHLGADVVAANSVASVVGNLATVASMGIASGGAILIGKEIGDRQIERVKADSAKMWKLALLCGVIGGLLILLIRPFVSSVVSLSDTAYDYLGTMLLISAYYVIGKSVNATIVCGLFCAGGDAKFGFIVDTIVMWGVSVPLGLLSAFVFKIPPMGVYFILCLDEFIKLPFIYRHYRRYSWLNDITRNFAEKERA
jgi:putative MATE family efflux protein